MSEHVCSDLIKANVYFKQKCYSHHHLVEPGGIKFKFFSIFAKTFRFENFNCLYQPIRRNPLINLVWRKFNFI